MEDKQSRWLSASTCFVLCLCRRPKSCTLHLIFRVKLGRMNAALTEQQSYYLQQSRGLKAAPACLRTATSHHLPQDRIASHSQHGSGVGFSQNLFLLIQKHEALKYPSILSRKKTTIAKLISKNRFVRNRVM